MTPLITVTFIIAFIVCTIQCYPSSTIVISSSPYEKYPLKIPYSASSATTYRLTIPDSSTSDFASESEARRKRQTSFGNGDESVDETLARLDLICNKLKKRSTATRNSGSRRSRDTEQLLSFLCKSMTIDDSDLL